MAEARRVAGGHGELGWLGGCDCGIRQENIPGASRSAFISIENRRGQRDIRRQGGTRVQSNSSTGRNHDCVGVELPIGWAARGAPRNDEQRCAVGRKVLDR